MAERIFIIPAEDSILRDTDGTIVASTGKEVPLNTYWSRRLKAGDCTKRMNKSFSSRVADEDSEETGEE